MHPWSARRGRDTVCAVAEALIALQRPAVMTAEMRAWISHRARDGKPALALGRAAGSERGSLLLRVELRSDSPDAAEEELTDLLTDMRLLGLRPTLVTDRVL